MLYSVHFFIGREFDSILEDLGRKLYRDGGEALKYCNIYRASEASDNNIAVSQLLVNKAEKNDDHVSQSVLTGWTELKTVTYEEWPESYVREIYNETLTADKSNQLHLPVFIHFPFYKASAVSLLSVMARAIACAGKPSKITFIGYGDDMVDVLEPGYKIESPSAAQLDKFDAIRNADGLSKQMNRFIFIHNSTQNGISLGMNDSTAYVEMLGQLMILMSAYMDQIFPMEAHDVTALGFASLNFNKYKFATYLLQKATLETIDRASVNSQCVDVNCVFAEVNRILYDKDKLLSRFFDTAGDNTDYKEHERLRADVEEIREKVLAMFAENKDITFKAAVLAALFSKTEYELFASSTYNLVNSCYLDLYSEPVNYFIDEDEAGFYKVNGEKAVNPIPKIKEINRVLMNAEEEIRTLEKRLQDQEKNLEDSEKVRDCFIEDEFFHFDDKKFRLLPNVIEEPLQETYVPKTVTVKSVDLRPYFRAAQSQGQQGSCLSFTITSIFEYMMKVNQSENCDLSEAFLYYNARNLDQTGDVSVNTDTGSRFKPAMDSLTQYGIALEMYCPYDEGVYDRKPSEAAYADAATRKLIKALNVDRNVEAVKSAIAEGYPVAASFTLCESFVPAGGYISMPTPEEIAETLKNEDNPEKMAKHTRHAMAIVGFSDELQMFLVRNSWGQDWGDNGYCYIPYTYVAHEDLFNYACIITEVASLAKATPELKQIQALKIDNTDVRIRYFITKAALESEKAVVAENQKQRAYWLEYFETVKSIFANANNRDDYVNANINKLNKDQLACENANRESIKKQEIEKESWLAYNKKAMIWTILTIVATSLLWIGINWASGKIHYAIYADAIEYNAQIDRGAFSTPAHKEVSNSAGLTAPAVDKVPAENPHKEHIPKRFRLKYVYLIPICSLYVLVCFIAVMKRRKQWLETRDNLQNQIDRNLKRIGQIRRKLEYLRFKAFAAWTLMRSLEEIQDYFLDFYNKMISLINNLRVWYTEVEDSNAEMDIVSRFPNISLLDREILDRYFENKLRKSSVCDMDICEGLDQYEISADFLSEFKRSLTSKIKSRLIQSLEERDFNVSAHVSDNAYDDLARTVDAKMLESLNYQSNIFVHINLQKRGDVSFMRLMFAADVATYENSLRQKLVSQCGVSDYRQSDDRYRMMLVTVASLFYDECELLRTNAGRR